MPNDLIYIVNLNGQTSWALPMLNEAEAVKAFEGAYNALESARASTLNKSDLPAVPYKFVDAFGNHYLLNLLTCTVILCSHDSLAAKGNHLTAAAAAAEKRSNLPVEGQLKN